MATMLCACNVSTAHISSLRTGSDKAMSTETTKFFPKSKIYAQAHAANLPNKVTIRWRLIAKNIRGYRPNTPLRQANVSTDLPSDGDSDYTLSPPTMGFPTGTYTIIATMMDNGTQRDQKSIDVTVSSGP